MSAAFSCCDKRLYMVNSIAYDLESNLHASLPMVCCSVQSMFGYPEQVFFPSWGLRQASWRARFHAS